jgi:pyruvate,water dikinase
MSFIRWLGDEDCHHDHVVGGKAAALSRLAALYEVPPGFAVAAQPATADALDEMLHLAIGGAYGTLASRRGADLPVAVRSSALDEDGAGSSFAGQHDTYLNIRGPAAVCDAVLRCVRSAASTEALAYRRQRGLDSVDVRIAVLVQELVQADVAAVAFSVNPLTGRRDEMMINASWGLGESIVGGSVTPDTFVVEKGGLETLSSDIARKDRMTVLSDGGTVEVEVPDALRLRSSLDDGQVREVARLATTLEETVGYPVDIECAFAGGTLYLLQCRPITTLG